MLLRRLVHLLWAFLTSVIPALSEVPLERFEAVCGGLGLSAAAGLAAGSASLSHFPHRVWHGAAAILGWVAVPLACGALASLALGARRSGGWHPELRHPAVTFAAGTILAVAFLAIRTVIPQ